MERLARQKVVDPFAMSDQERARFGDTLYGLCRRVFEGVSRKAFLESAFSPTAARLRVLVLENAASEMVGYFIAQLFLQPIDGRIVPVFRTEAGILPAYRGRHATVSFGLREAALYKLRHPFQDVFYLGMLVHPSSYHLLAKYFPLIYPSRLREIPQDRLLFMAGLADAFGTPRIDSDPLRRAVGWITREPPEQPGHSPEALADARFFAEMNPGYEAGHGLVTLVPLTFTNLLVGTWRFLMTRLALFR